MLGEEFIDPGYQVTNSEGHNFINQVEVTGLVDTNKVGVYEIIYSLTDLNEETINVTRKVIVMNISISPSKSNDEYTNKNIDINLSIDIDDDYFSGLELPNETKINEKRYTYTINKNGIYTFSLYNNNKKIKEKSINITNIDKEKPTGKCSGSYADGKSNINITASDNIKIKNYKILNTYYSSDKIQLQLNQELPQVSITIQDIAGNSSTINCQLEDKNKFITSDPNISFSYEYVSDGNTMPYALYTPSTASKGKPTPLIIWLHGLGEFKSSQSTFEKSGLLHVLNNWKLEKFNAYVLCPYSAKNGYTSGWNNTTAKSNIENLLQKIISKYNIDKNKIIICGHSSGAIGVEYIVSQKKTYFSAMAILSGYDYNINLTELTHIPTKGFVESYGSPYSYMTGRFSKTFGSENVKVYKVSHGEVPKMAFTEDKNNDNKFDLIEWMLQQSK